MPYYAWPDLELGGLDLLNDPETVGWSGAIDLLNIQFDRLGRIRSRDGYARLTASSGSSRYSLLGQQVGQSSELLCSTGTSGAATAAISTTGGTVDATMAGQMQSLPATISTPGASAAYIPCGTATTLQKVTNGNVFSAPTATVDGVAGKAMPMATVVGVTPWDNRLVAANTGSTGGPNGAASSNEHVWFSDAGLPESWHSNNYVQLNPGENDGIQAIVSWREMLFVFKRRRFYVFTGTSTDSAGNPIFNYRTVDAGAGCEPGQFAVGCAISTPDGVYFSNTHGIWKTTGGPPVLVSQQIGPLFGVGQPIPPWYTGPNFLPADVGVDTTSPWLTWLDNRLFASMTYSGNSCVAVLDMVAGMWSVWDIPAQTMLGVPSTDRGTSGDLYFTYGSGTNDIGVIYGAARRFPTMVAATDAGAPITSRYQSGFNKFSYKSHFRYIGYGEEKTIRQTQLKGYGSPTLTWYRDYQSTAMPGSGQTVNLATAPNVARGLDRNAARGESLSFKLSNGASILDDFSTDTIGAGKYTFDTGSGTISVSGGQLVPSSTAEKRMVRNDSLRTDTQGTIQVTTGASVASGSAGILLRWVDANNFLYAQLNFAGASSTVTIVKRVAGVDSTLNTSSAFTTAAATSYWLRFSCVRGILTAAAYTSDPAIGGGSRIGSVAAYTLAAADNAQIPNGQTGMRLIPQATDYRYDNLRVDPLGWQVDTFEAFIRGERPQGEET